MAGRGKEKQLSHEEYQTYKKAWDGINLDFNSEMSDMRYPYILGDERAWYHDQMQTEARFREARRRALRSRYGLPRIVDYNPPRPGEGRR